MTRAPEEASHGGGEPDPSSAIGIEGAVRVELSPDVIAKIEATATAFVERLVTAEPASDAFRRSVAAVDGLGDREVRATTQIVAAFQDRPRAAVQAILAERAPLKRNLELLARTAHEVGRVAGDARSSGEDLAAAVRTAEERVRRVVPALDADRQTLEGDNAALAQQERALWMEIRTLRRYATLAERIDEMVDERAASLEAMDPARARPLRVDALYAVRRRRRDLLLQLAVASQAYAALRLIEQDNLEVIWAIRVATTTSVTALRSALLVAQTMSDRRQPTMPVADDVAGAWDEVVAAVGAAEARRRQTLAEVRERRPAARPGRDTEPT